MGTQLSSDFFKRNVLEVAPEILGKSLCRKFDNTETREFIITEVEAYNGISDLACHASKGRTPRTEIMFSEGGLIYVYLIYGMYWLLNIVTGTENDASAVLIRGVEGISGPGRVGKILEIDKSFYGENILSSNRLWIENTGTSGEVKTSPRVGINYAGEPWISKPWRYELLI